MFAVKNHWDDQYQTDIVAHFIHLLSEAGQLNYGSARYNKGDP